jgi:hypothetical protein
MSVLLTVDRTSRQYLLIGNGLSLRICSQLFQLMLLRDLAQSEYLHGPSTFRTTTVHHHQEQQKKHMKINANFQRFAACHFDAVKYIPSPSYGVNRFMLDRIGNEKARATTIVQYQPNS